MNYMQFDEFFLDEMLGSFDLSEIDVRWVYNEIV